jgi:GntR family transcriptional regulator of arabinose operon
MEKNTLWELITINGSETVPKYRQLQSEIKRLIAENVLTINTRLPGENEFFSRLGLSRTTIRKALQSLEKEHLIYRVQGQGTFIGSRPSALSEKVGDIRYGKAKKLIGVIVPNITNEIYPFIISGIEQSVRPGHFCVFSANSGGSHDRELRIVNEMLNNSIDGLILEPLYSGFDDKEARLVSVLEKLTIPVVLINNDIPTFECSKVMQDDEGGSRLITEHLLEHGHKRIAFIYNDKISAGFERRKGYRTALAAAGIEHDPRLEIAYNDEQGIVYPGYVFTKQLLEDPHLGVTAIFYYNDDLAFQGLIAAQSLNLEVPRDLSIAGYDDIPRSRLNGIWLTTVSHPKALMGNWAASLLLEQFDQLGGFIHRKINVHSPIIRRGSVAAPRPAVSQE